MRDVDWAMRQRELLQRHTEWVRAEGGTELPVQLDTYMRPDQKERLRWLAERVVGRTVDLGCSWGYVLAFVQGDGGVDINPNLLDLARLLAPDREFTCADIRSLPMADGSFDTAIIAETLEHLPYPYGVEQAITQAVRVAKKKVLVTLPQPGSQDAESFKHMWLAGPEEVGQVSAWLRAGEVLVTRLESFICLEARLESGHQVIG